MSLLHVEDLRVHFHTRNGIVKAVDGVSFDLEKGKTLGIVGESGSGKSVTCYSLLGLLPTPPARIESGSALFDGVDLLKVPEATLRTYRGNRIAIIFQDPMTSLNPFMTIGAQLIEPLRIHMGMSRRAATDRAMAALREVGITEPQRRMCCYPHEFSGGMRQRVMIAMGLATEPDILIADEPTTALDVTIEAQILELIRKLQESHGIAMIYISHDLGIVAGIADHVLVMQNGVVVERGAKAEIFHRPQHPYTRKLIDSIPRSAKPAGSTLAETQGGSDFLRIEEVRISYPVASESLFDLHQREYTAVDGVSLQLAKGEILGLVGESGSGKSTLARAIVRLVDLKAGRIRMEEILLSELSGQQLNDTRPEFQMIFQDPYASLNPRMTVQDCLAEALERRGRKDRKELQAEILALLADVELLPEHLRKYPHEFSGGQRQRIAIARALALKPKLMVADEPVSALDVTVQAQILKLLLELNRKYRMSMIFISHDLGVIRYIADRTAVLYQGKLVECGPTERIFNHPEHPYTQKLLSAVRTSRLLEGAE
ncbi:MAG: ABC transporter ATP-binding protein [Gammaproteobacteria bacterium]|nr:MAG: ABC transporter ATP-binding protein [Gammaproteobacteria bacterium]